MIKLLFVIFLLYVGSTEAVENCKPLEYDMCTSLLPHSRNTKDFNEMKANMKIIRSKCLCFRQGGEQASGEGYGQSSSKTYIYQRDRWGTVRYDQPSFVIIQK